MGSKNFVIRIELSAGCGPKSHAIGIRVPTLRKLREEWGTRSIGDINEVKIWGTRQALRKSVKRGCTAFADSRK